MRKLKKGWWKKGSVCLLMALVLTYAFAGFFRILDGGKSFVNSSKYLMDYNGTLNFVFYGKQGPEIIIGIFFVLVSMFIFKKADIYDKSYIDASRFGIHGTSRWGNVDELQKDKIISKKIKLKKDPVKMLESVNGILLGRSPNDNRLIIIPKDTKISNRNVLVVGSSGSGKGQSFVNNNIVTHTESSIIVTDPKGELYRDTAQIKRDQGFKVYSIDFVNMKGKYNPLDYVASDLDSVKVAQSVSKNSAKDVKQDFFFSMATNLLTGLIIYCKETYGMAANISETVKKEFYKIKEDEEYLPNICLKIGEDDPAYRYLKDASAAEDRTRSGILSSFAQQTGIFSLQNVVEMTKESEFDFHDFEKHKSILYVKMPMKDNPVAALTATFFDQLITVMYDIADKQKDNKCPIPLLFLLDEFANIGRINEYENVLATCRGLGISMNTIVQDFAQLEQKYGKEVARSIINNHDTALYLRTKDPETAKYFSRLAGDTTAKMNTGSISHGDGWLEATAKTTTSQGEQYVKRPLITEGELIGIKVDDAYLFMSGYYPLKIKKAWNNVIFKDFMTNYEQYKEQYRDYTHARDKEREDIKPIIFTGERFKKEDNEKTKVIDHPENPVNVGSEKEKSEKDYDPIILNPDEAVNTDIPYKDIADSFINDFNVPFDSDLEDKTNVAETVHESKPEKDPEPETVVTDEDIYRSVADGLFGNEGVIFANELSQVERSKVKSEKQQEPTLLIQGQPVTPENTDDLLDQWIESLEKGPEMVNFLDALDTIKHFINDATLKTQMKLKKETPETV